MQKGKNKWRFQNEPTPDFSKVPYFKSKSKLSFPKGHPAIEFFFKKRRKRKAMWSLVDDKQIIIKKPDKGSCVVVWDRDSYLLENERQLKDGKIYRSVTFNEKLIEDLTTELL